MPSDGTTNKTTLIIMMGESNSGGLARNSQAQSVELGIRPGVKILNNYNLRFESLNISNTGNNILEHLGPNGIPDVTSSVWNTAGGPPHGWELGLANAVSKNKYAKNTVYLLKAGHGGSKLGDETISGDWEPGDLYFNKFEERYSAAIQQIFELGLVPQCYVWYEIGINDCLVNVKPDDWKQKFIQKIRNVRRIIGYKAPFFITLLPDVAFSGTSAGNLKEFNQKIIELSSEVAGVYYVKTDDCHLRENDIYHWDYYGMKLIAERMTYLSAELFGEENAYEASLVTPPVQPNYESIYSPVFAVTPYSSTQDPVLDYVYPVYAVRGRLSANKINDEPGSGTSPSHIGNPDQAITFFNQKGIPANRRVIFQQNIGSATFDSVFMDYSSYGKTYAQVYDIEDSCRDSSYSILYQDTTDPRESSNQAYAGSLPFVSPWTRASHTRLEEWTRDWVSTYKALNGKIYGFISDNESVSPVANRTPQGNENIIPLRYDNNTQSKVTHFEKIINDPRAYTTTFDSGYAYDTGINLRNQLQLSIYTASDFNTPETRTVDDPQYKGAYFHWDYVINSFAMWYANKHWYDVISDYYPNHNSAHVYSYYIPKEDHYTDREGYVGYGNQLVGNTCNVLFFGFIGGVSQNSEIDPSDKTRTRFLSTYNPGGTPIGNRAWISLLMQQQLVKCIKRHPENQKFMPWIGSRNIGAEYAFGGLSDPNHNSLWSESVYHMALHNPNAIYFFYPRNANGTDWTAETNNQSLYALNQILKEVNTKTENKIVSNISSTIQRIELDSKVLITGCKTVKETHLWRITADVVNVNTVVLDGTNYSVDSINPGFWIETDTNIVEIQTVSYNSTTKTIVLTTGAIQIMPHAKTEPGSVYKYAPNCYAPIRLDDGTADHIYINRFVESLQVYKQDQERRYRTNKLTEAPGCLIQDFTGSVDEYFENGVFKPKYFNLNIEGHLSNMINCVNPSFRAGPNQYGSVNSYQVLDDKTFQRVVSYIKLLRKLAHHVKLVFGSQVKIYFSDPAIIHVNNEWEPNWFNTFWSTGSISVSDTNGKFRCPHCEELIPAFDQTTFENQEFSQKITTIYLALEKLQIRLFKWYNSVAKMLLFVPAEEQEDVLDLSSELSSIFPQIEPSNFIITGLNVYSNSSIDVLSHSTYRFSAMVTNRYEPSVPANITTRLEDETLRNRSIVSNLKTLGISNNILTGQVYSHTIQQYCGFDAWLGFYETYNGFDGDENGYIRSWSDLSWEASELNQFTTTSPTATAAGNRTIRNRNNRNNTNRRNFLRDFPRIVITNDELYKYNLAQSLNSNSSILINWNTSLLNIDSNLSSRPLTAKNDFYNQLRPCADGELVTQNCRDIRTVPYSTPHYISDSFKLRLNQYTTFNCNSDEQGCVDYCTLNMEPGVGNNNSYSILQGLVTRKWLYDLAIEYASYDDGVAIPFKDYTNENYWFGYFGRNAQFDPFITTPPSTISAALRMDDTLWPHYQRSETGKRMDALAIILSARKEASLWKFYKNRTTTNIKDWPQPPANFTVNRAVGSVSFEPIKGGYINRKYLGWGDKKYWKKQTGIQEFINDYLRWNYRRGVRRFVIWSPCGVLPTPDGLEYSITSAITSSMTKRVYAVYDKEGNVIDQVINPCEACWDGNDFAEDPSTGLRIPQTIEEALNESILFDENARINEWSQYLSAWLSTSSDAEVGIHLGYGIPVVNNTPSNDITIYGEVGIGSNKGYNTTWQVPDPKNNTLHSSFLQNELQPWIDMGIKFFSFDNGFGMFNYQNGGLLLENITASPVGDYKQWFHETWPETITTIMTSSLPVDFKAPIVDEFNRSTNANYPRKTIYTKNVQTEVCKGRLIEQDDFNSYNSVYEPIDCWSNPGRERYRKLEVDGKTYTNMSYVGKAYQYCPYFVNVNLELNSADWNIGLHNTSTLNLFGGIDPNEMLCWYRNNTEINAIFDDMYKLSSSMLNSYRTVFRTDETYSRLWEFTPAWQDQGIQTPTPPPSNLTSWDGRNYSRDGDYYNKVRNEMFLKVKNYIDRGYVFWSTVNKNDFQLIKDVHRDCLDYAKGYEIDSVTLYEQDISVITQASQQTQPPAQSRLKLNLDNGPKIVTVHDEPLI